MGVTSPGEILNIIKSWKDKRAAPAFAGTAIFTVKFCLLTPVE